jgi:hypothetical protein
MFFPWKNLCRSPPSAFLTHRYQVQMHDSSWLNSSPLFCSTHFCFDHATFTMSTKKHQTIFVFASHSTIRGRWRADIPKDLSPHVAASFLPIMVHLICMQNIARVILFSMMISRSICFIRCYSYYSVSLSVCCVLCSYEIMNCVDWREQHLWSLHVCYLPWRLSVES